MFEESEWSDGGGGADSSLPRGQRRRPRAAPAAASSPGRRQQQQQQRRRRRLLATLRRLEGAARQPRPSSPSDGGDSSASDWEPEPARSSGPPPPPPPPPHRAGQERPQKEADAAAGDGNLAAIGKQSSPGATEEEEEERPRQPLTRKQWRNRQKNKRRQKNKFKAGVGQGKEEPPCSQAPEAPRGPGSPALAPSPEEQPPSARAASLRLRMEGRLESARFRYINQQLYTRPSREAARLFREDPQAFAVYHHGFARQVACWPENPVQRFVRYLRQRPASLVVADFGCGDCTLAQSVRNKVHCFDLVALDPRVTVCDMAQVPLEAESVDVAVFCLALMGTNLREILEEASRVLRVGGTLLVAEVASRFADVRAFLGALARLGFRLLSQDVSGSHFYTFELRKAKATRQAAAEGAAQARGRKPPPPPPLPGLALQPCLYKRR
ncbi:ribosomal RNA-processing protein 8 [Hemicordylus capensis]|uniref:ribosomal RNA-processing protein 8 n=1 Tax=Hemicordylus capensis TaxID=884348 RepID=UPI0023022843|nr:ribosomal RNA-processing protein 8 [Hemicordylus capensis]